MDKLRKSALWGRLILPFIAGSALLSAALVNVLRLNDYPLLTWESTVVLSGLVIIASIVSILYYGQRFWGRAFLECIFVVIFLDLSAAPRYLAIVGGIGALVFVALRRSSILPFAAVVSLVLLLTTLVGVGDRRAWIETTQSRQSDRKKTDIDRLPIIVHIILDEHIGIEGVPDEHPGAKLLQEDLKKFYLSRGFNLFGRAFSESMHTVNALPMIFNFGARPEERSSTKGVIIGKNEYFYSLLDKGYRIRAYQSDFANICDGSRVEICTTYLSWSLRGTLDYPLTMGERSNLIILKLLRTSSIIQDVDDTLAKEGRTFAKIGIQLPRIELRRRTRSTTLAALKAFDIFVGDLRTARPGDVIIGHFLIPHFPYVVSSDCSVLRFRDWDARRSTSAKWVRQSLYFGQVRCSMRKIDEALEKLRETALDSNYVIVVHGDHGSRITDRDPTSYNVGEFTREDLIAAYSTLFAFRSSGLPPMYLTHPAPVSNLLKDLTQSDFMMAPGPPAVGTPRSVVLDDIAWRPKSRVRLPEGW